MSSHVPDDTTRYLAELAGLGEYFALRVADGDEWHCLADLFTDQSVTRQVARMRTAMAESAGCAVERVPVRVAASSFQLGVAARLLSPVIGSVLCFRAVPVLDHRSARWRPSAGAAPQFAVTGPVWVGVTTDRAAADVIATSVLAALTGLGARLDALMSLSSQVTLGNLASAANGAVTVLAMSRPELRVPGRALVRALLDTAPLSGTGTFTADQFRRRSCCLYYQAPSSGLCGDCVLAVAATSQPGAAH